MLKKHTNAASSYMTAQKFIFGASRQAQAGFTLIELMISLVLGLLITAAVFQVYIAMVRTSAIQRSGSEINDASIFGIQQVEQKLRLANLGNTVNQINQTTGYGGIVLSGANLNYSTDQPAPNDIAQKITVSADGNTTAGTSPLWSKISNTNVGSDQLVIQYQNVTGENILDCENNTVAQNAHVVERYFLREPSTNTNVSQNMLVLACDAGRVGVSGILPANNSVTPKIPGFGGAGEELILNVDQFKVEIGIQNGNTLTYITPAQYNALDETSPLYRAPIVAVKLGLLVRGAMPVVGDFSAPSSYMIFGQANTPKNANDKYIRKTYESTTFLRNARVVTP
ncbi:Tfp pilus assembly protein PilW [Moraxella atlantae]|uniref:Tfp pilus assembly protein PilW n=2 Tax=Faucicola atlantae TaxID=34059 RepID=A0A378Q2M1_9GAMM|nr:Tfp pilus assembly protein PilW [Moraxella atlantae]